MAINSNFDTSLIDKYNDEEEMLFVKQLSDKWQKMVNDIQNFREELEISKSHVISDIAVSAIEEIEEEVDAILNC